MGLDKEKRQIIAKYEQVAYAYDTEKERFVVYQIEPQFDIWWFETGKEARFFAEDID